MSKDRLSFIQWETLGNQIANSINNLPIAIRNQIADVENIDILIPNKLMVGGNNNRSPVGAWLLVTNQIE